MTGRWLSCRRETSIPARLTRSTRYAKWRVARGAWVHVDGAFGLWAAASETKRALVRGIEKADSWSVDAHKTLNAPYDCGIVLCRDRQALVDAMQATGSYIQYGE